MSEPSNLSGLAKSVIEFCQAPPPNPPCPEIKRDDDGEIYLRVFNGASEYAIKDLTEFVWLIRHVCRKNWATRQVVVSIIDQYEEITGSRFEVNPR